MHLLRVNNGSLRLYNIAHSRLCFLRETQKEPTLAALQIYVREGWPDEK